MIYRRLEEYLQSFNFRRHFMFSKERQVPTALLPGEVTMVPIALCRLCGVRYRLQAVGKSKISLRPGKRTSILWPSCPQPIRCIQADNLFCQIRFCPTVQLVGETYIFRSANVNVSAITGSAMKFNRNFQRPCSFVSIR